MKPRVIFSVIIPLYNKEAYIERALKSVFAQDFQDFEVIVVDDGSTDGGIQRVANSFGGEERLRMINQQNTGEGGARNRGIREMRGEIAAFLDADDEWLPNHLSLVAFLARRFPDAGWFATGYRSVFPGTLTVETTIRTDQPLISHEYFRISTGAYPIAPSAAAVRSSVLDSAGGFAVGEPVGADQDFFARLALRSALAYEPTVSAIYYCMIPQSAMSSARWDCRPPLVVRTLEQQMNGPMPGALSNSLRRYLDWVLLEHVFAGLSAGYGQEALDLLTRRKTKSALVVTLVRYLIPASVVHFAMRVRRRLRYLPPFENGRLAKSRAIVKRFHRLAPGA